MGKDFHSFTGWIHKYKAMYGLNENEYDAEFRSRHALKTVPQFQGRAFDLDFDVVNLFKIQHYKSFSIAISLIPTLIHR